ncbi:DNA replication and repair protein RecF [Candidatus Xenohaliotis californiensis]|uniref:DNA replication and repair protein RecF n=1 Tax=Candidatus Xenohaliotis californiensis TaxID=84677 RepID=A0ABP0EWU7_9RICK|nr:DNA replication and repair protein RecF [Candidatus Xenohaliotis californiensis]
MNCLIKELSLKNFRNHKNININLNPGINAVVGANASGKTSILEAISMLYPGRGIKNSTAANITMLNSKNDYWYTEGRFLQRTVDCTIATEYHNKKKLLLINGEKSSSSKLLKNIQIIWLSPAISHKIIMSMSSRRQFIDRITYLFCSNHAKLISKYEKAVQERNKLLLNKNYNKNWMCAIEKNLAETAINVMFNRTNAINLLNKTATDKTHNATPVQIEIISNTTHAINDEPSEAVSKMLKSFDISRNKDMETCRTNIGPHRCEVRINNPINKTPIDNASSGEQKLMLTSIMLMQVLAKKLEHNTTPIILLDDITTQLDSNNIKILLNALSKINCQSIISDTMQNKNYTTIISLK